MGILDQLPAWAVVIGIALLWVALAVGLLLLVRRFVAVERLEPHNDVSGFVFAGVGVVYAVLLAFLVIGVWEGYEEQRRIIDSEAGHLVTVHRLAGMIEGADATKAATRAYAESVIRDDWPAMRSGRLSGDADAAFHEIAMEATRVPAFSTGGGWADLYVNDLHELRMARTARATAVASSLPGVLWLVLVLGGAIAVGYVVLYGMRNLLLHVILTAAFAALVGLSVGVVVVLDAPYRGPDGIPPDAFLRAIERMEP